MIKYRLVIGSVIIVLLLSIVMGLYLHATTPPNKNVSKEIHITTLSSNDSMYYSKNIKSITYRDCLYTFWIDEGNITYSVYDAYGNNKGVFELKTKLTNPKKIEIIPNDNMFEIYVMEDAALNKYTVDINSQNIVNSLAVYEGVSDFFANDNYIVVNNEGILNIINNNQILYSSESGVDSFQVFSINDKLHIVYKVQLDGKKNIKYFSYDRNNKYDLLYSIDNVELTSSSLESIFVSDNGDVGILFQKDNRAKDTTFIYTLLSNDGGRSFDIYTHSTSFMNIDLKFGHIDSEKYSIYEIYRGDLFLNTYNESKLIKSLRLTNTLEYSTNINTGMIGSDFYYQWSEKSNEKKELYFASSNKEVITKSIQLTKDDKLIIIVDTLIILLTTTIPMFVLLLYLGIIIGVLVVFLKIILKDELANKTKIVSRIIGVVYIVLLSGYLVFYLNKHFEINIFSRYINQWQFIVINIIIALLAYVSTHFRNKHTNSDSQFEKVTHFMIVEFVFISLFTMPNILIAWFGKILFF